MPANSRWDLIHRLKGSSAVRFSGRVACRIELVCDIRFLLLQVFVVI